MVKQYEVYWVDLDPTVGREINKTRPCVIITPDVANENFGTVLIAPITSTIRNFPMRIIVQIKRKSGQIALDQIRSVDKIRLKNKIGSLKKSEITDLKLSLTEYLIK